MPTTPTKPETEPNTYKAYLAFLGRIRTASHRYDMPAMPTWLLQEAVEKAVGREWARSHGCAVLDIVDIVRTIIGEPTIQDVKIGCELIGRDYESDAIRIVCQRLRDGDSLDAIIAAGDLDAGDREAIEEVLAS